MTHTKICNFIDHNLYIKNSMLNSGCCLDNNSFGNHCYKAKEINFLFSVAFWYRNSNGRWNYLVLAKLCSTRQCHHLNCVIHVHLGVASKSHYKDMFSPRNVFQKTVTFTNKWIRTLGLVGGLVMCICRPYPPPDHELFPSVHVLLHIRKASSRC